MRTDAGETRGTGRSAGASAQASVDRVALGLLLISTLGVSTAYGMLLLLPIYITKVGGNESSFGVISAAGAVTSAAAIGFLIRYPLRFPPQHVLAASAVAYGAGAFAMSFVHSVDASMVLLGLLLGTAWALVYTSAPMVISAVVDDSVRGRYIGFVTGMIQVGFGLGPIVGNTLLHAGLTYNAIFRIAALVTVLAALITATLSRRLPELSGARRPRTDVDVSLLAALRAIVRSPAAIPLLSILLGACMFTSMNSFQGTFANHQHMNFDIFYGSYTLAVIFARFILVRYLPDPSSLSVLRVSSVGITASVLTFLLVGSDPVVYGVASAMLGITYGLTLPAAQARAVNLGPAELRARMLPLAGLVFETTVLVFPLVSGYVIHAWGYEAMFALLLFFSLILAAAGFIRPGARTPEASAELPAAESVR